MPGSPADFEPPAASALETYVLCAAQAIDLPIPAEYRPGVVDNYARILPLARLVMGFSLPPEIEAASVFRA